jgi:peptide chain release factor 1
MLIPRDPDDTKDVIMEIRSGTGGDEASIFAGDLFRMYTKYFDSKGWKYEIDYVNEGSAGGYNKVALEIYGEDVYGHLKFELAHTFSVYRRLKPGQAHRRYCGYTASI